MDLASSIVSHIIAHPRSFFIALGFGSVWGFYVYQKFRNLWQLMGLTSFVPVQSVYDFIIVGGGTSGCILASRISENHPDCKVLLLEAGSALLEDVNIQSPFLWTARWFDFQTEWNLRTCAQKHLNNREIEWHRSRVLGGNGANDNLIYLRGESNDFNSWESDFGLSSWSYENLLAFFKKSERFLDLKSDQDECRGNNGELQVKTLCSPSNLASTFVKSCEELGIPSFTGDYNDGRTLIGTGLIQTTITETNERAFGANSFLRPAFLNNSNLTVRTEALVTKVIIEKSLDGFQATGIHWRGSSLGEGTQLVKAKKQIILSAGPVGSSQLLLLSGIGPSEHLSEHAIDVIQDLPVGEHLQDQVMINLNYKAKNPSDSSDNFLAKRFELAKNLFQFVYFRTGQFIQPIIEALALVKLESNSEECSKPVQHLICTRNFQNCSSINSDSTEGFGILSILLQPESKGHIRLQSSDPLVPPIIDPNYLAVENDKTLLVKAAQQSVQITQTDSFISLCGDPIMKDLQGDLASQTQNFWEEFILTNACSANHPIGTCRMGKDKLNSVVNERLEVHGVKGLRVADSSVMPKHITSCTPRAVSMVIAERASSFIKEDFSTTI